MGKARWQKEGVLRDRNVTIYLGLTYHHDTKIQQGQANITRRQGIDVAV